MNTLRNFNSFINENFDEEEMSNGITPQSAEGEGFFPYADLGAFYKIEDDTLCQVSMLRNGAPDRNDDGELNVTDVTHLYPEEESMIRDFLSSEYDTREVDFAFRGIEILDAN